MTPAQKKRIAHVTATLEKLADIAPPKIYNLTVEIVDTLVDSASDEMYNDAYKSLNAMLPKIRTRLQGLIGHKVRVLNRFGSYNKTVDIVPEEVTVDLVQLKNAQRPGIYLRTILKDGSGETVTVISNHACFAYH